MFLKGDWSPITFVTDYFSIVFIPILYFAAKLMVRVHTVSADDMDFVRNVAEFDVMTCVPLHCLERHANAMCAQ
jgi:amino acid permease